MLTFFDPYAHLKTFSALLQTESIELLSLNFNFK